MSERIDRLFIFAITASFILMALLFISYYVHGVAVAGMLCTIVIIFFQITVPFEVLKRLGLHAREFNIYAHNIDMTLDVLFPPFGRMRNKPDFVGMARELLTFVVVTIVIFVPYILAYWGWQELVAHKEHLRVIISWNFPPHLGYEILTQIFVIALPEEIFFRGFLQSALLKKIHPSHKRPPWLSSAVILTNLIFALGHVASTMNPTRLLTFFPGMVFSYLVLRNKSLLAAILFHAACNILGQILYASFYLR